MRPVCRRQGPVPLADPLTGVKAVRVFLREQAPVSSLPGTHMDRGDLRDVLHPGGPDVHDCPFSLGSLDESWDLVEIYLLVGKRITDQAVPSVHVGKAQGLRSRIKTGHQLKGMGALSTNPTAWSRPIQRL
jgi:hypothetical protein